MGPFFYPNPISGPFFRACGALIQLCVVEPGPFNLGPFSSESKKLGPFFYPFDPIGSIMINTAPNRMPPPASGAAETHSPRSLRGPVGLKTAAESEPSKKLN